MQDPSARLWSCIVLICSFCLACLVYTTFAANLQFHFAKPPHGPIIGWATVHGYPKQQEIFYYVSAVAIIPSLALGITLAWLQVAGGVARKLRLLPGTVLSTTALAFVPVLYECYKFLWHWPPHGYGQLRRAIISLLIAYGLALLYCRYSEKIRGFIFCPANVLYNATVLIAGSILGCYLPFLFPDHSGSVLAKLWWVSPVVCWLLWVRFSLLTPGKTFADAERRAQSSAMAFTPLALLLAYPFLLSSYRLRVVLLLAAGVGGIVVWAWRSSPSVAPGRGVFHYWHASVVAMVLATVNMSANPRFLPGVAVPPLDGDHTIAWFYNGLHGQLPYRDFFYPYGPLRYYHNLLCARLFGLDNYQLPAEMLATIIIVLLLYRTAPALYRTRLFLLLGPVAMFLYGAELRVYLGFGAVLLSLLALQDRSPRRLTWAGGLTGVAFLYSPEVGVCAALTAGAISALYAFRSEHGTRFREARTYALAQIAGASILIIPAAVIGLVTGTLRAYAHDIFMLLSIANRCCAAAFPSILQAPVSLKTGLLGSDIFKTYYFAPLTYIIAMVYVGWQFLQKRCLSTHEIAALGTLLFGGLLFKTALTRSDDGHLAFASLPAVALFSALLDRALFRACVTFAGGLEGDRPPSPGGASIHWLRLRDVLYGALLLGFIVSGLKNTVAYERVPETVAGIVTILRGYHVLTFIKVQRDPAMVPLQNPEGTVFLFPASTAPHVKRVQSYLKAHLESKDTIFCLPFVARYYLLLSRVSPRGVGPELWGGAADPIERRRVIRDLEKIKPAYAVYDEAEWPDADGIPWIDRLQEIMDYLFSHYQVVAKIDTALILRRSEEPPLPPQNIATGELENQLYLPRGWYHIESSGPAVGRWTTLDATALVTRKPGDNALTLTALSFGTESRNVSVSINGLTVAWQPILPGWRTYNTDVPSSVPVRTVNKIEFRTDMPFQSPDPRQLGIFVKSFGFAKH